MKTFASLLTLVLVSAVAHAEDIWRWKDAKGTICYSNRAETVPADATTVKTRLTIEASRLPDGGSDLATDRGMVIDARAPRPPRRRPVERLHRIYSEKRLHFGCYSSSVLYSGGWAHPDDISVVGNCLPYLLGPEAWLNAARAELALREHGLDWRQLVPMYLAEGAPTPTPRLTDVSNRD